MEQTQECIKIWQQLLNMCVYIFLIMLGVHKMWIIVSILQLLQTKARKT